MCNRATVTRFAALLLIAVYTSAGCGYTLAGRGSSLPSYIRTIGVPLFANSTTAFELEEILTQRVRAEFIGRGKYKVVPESTGVDAVLEGEIVGLSLTPSGFTSERQASRYTLNITARIEFRDLKANTVIWANPGLMFTDEYEVTTSATSVDPAAFFGQESNAVDRLATDFARTVVSAILEAF